MPRIDEQEILRRLDLISQIEPSPEAIALAMERVRRVLVNMPGKEETPNPIEIWRTILKTRMLRFAAAAIITIFILLPLSYGVVKIIKTYFFQEKPISTTQNGVTVTKTNATELSGEYADENQARKVYDEINRLREAGKYEKTLIKEWTENGILHQVYRVRYVLASGEVIIMNEGQAANDINDSDANRPKDEK